MNRASRRSPRDAPCLPARQHGTTLFIVLIVFALMSVGAAVTMFGERNVDAAAAQSTAAALASSRDALIGYATSRGAPTGTARPGEFPCPDVNNDGREDLSTTAPVG